MEVDAETESFCLPLIIQQRQMKHEWMKHEWMKHEWMNHEWMKHEWMNHDRMKHEWMNHEWMKHEWMTTGVPVTDCCLVDLSSVGFKTKRLSGAKPHSAISAPPLASGSLARSDSPRRDKSTGSSAVRSRARP